MNVDKILKLIGPKLTNQELDDVLKELLSIDQELSDSKVKYYNSIFLVLRCVVAVFHLPIGILHVYKESLG